MTTYPYTISFYCARGYFVMLKYVWSKTNIMYCIIIFSYQESILSKKNEMRIHVQRKKMALAIMEMIYYSLEMTQRNNGLYPWRSRQRPDPDTMRNYGESSSAIVQNFVHRPSHSWQKTLHTFPAERGWLLVGSPLVLQQGVL